MSDILDSRIGVRMFIDWELDDSVQEVRKGINTFKREIEELTGSDVSSSIEISDGVLVGVDFLIDSQTEPLILLSGIVDSFNEADIPVSKDNVVISSEPSRVQKLRPRVESNLMIRHKDKTTIEFGGMDVVGEDIDVSSLESVVSNLGWDDRYVLVSSMVSRGPLEEALTDTVRDALEDT